MAKVIKGTGSPVGEELGAVSPETGFADIQKRKPVVVTKETFEAKDQAQRIVGGAQGQAEQIVADAQMQAQKILADAKMQADKLKADAQEQGFKKGANDAAAKYTEMVAEHGKRLDKKEAEVATQIRQLSLAIAKKIIGKELEFNPDAVVEMAKKHLNSIRQRREVYLRVSPTDLETLREHKRDLIEQLGRAKEIEIRADDTLSAGSMVIETEAGTIDARLETQMQVIERVLMGKKPI